MNNPAEREAPDQRTDAEYIKAMAEGVGDWPAPDIKAHKERLLRIAAALEAAASPPLADSTAGVVSVSGGGDSMKCTKNDCVGCRDDFYNHRTGFDGATQCWCLADAEKTKARDVPINLPPPYLHIPLTTRPNCYRAQGYVRVVPERLDAKGFWK